MREQSVASVQKSLRKKVIKCFNDLQQVFLYLLYKDSTTTKISKAIFGYNFQRYVIWIQLHFQGNLNKTSLSRLFGYNMYYISSLGPKHKHRR